MKLTRKIDSMTRKLSSFGGSVDVAPPKDKEVKQATPKPKRTFSRKPGFEKFDHERLAKFIAGKAAERAKKQDSAATLIALIKAAGILIREHGAFSGVAGRVSMMDQDASDIEAIRSDPTNAEIWINVAIKLLTAYASRIPATVDEASLGVEIKAHGVLTDSRGLSEQWALILTERNSHASEVMKPWHRSVRENLKRMPDARLDKATDIFPTEQRSNKSAYDLAHDAFRGTPLLKLLTDIRLPMPMPYHVRTKHMQVVGPSGSGKSMFLKNILNGDILSGHGVFVIDCEGDLSETLIWHCMGDRKLAERLVYIDLADPTLRPEINLLRLGKSGSSTDMMSYVMSGLGEGFTGRMGGFFEQLADVMVEIDDATLDTMIDILSDDGSAEINMRHLSAESRNWIEKQLVGSTNIQTREYVHGRLSRLRSKAMGEVGRMFRGKETKLALRDWLDDGKIVVIRINGDPVDEGGLGEYANLASRFYSAAYVVAGLKRPINPKRLWLGHWDEAAEHVGGGDDRFLSRGFNRLRKRGACLAFYHQNLRQLKGDLSEAVAGSTAIKGAAKVKPVDQEKLAEHMSCSKKLFGQVRMKDYAWAEMVFSIEGVIESGAICRFPLGTMERQPRISRERYSEIMNEQRAFWRSVNGEPVEPDVDDGEEETVIPMKKAASESPFL